MTDADTPRVPDLWWSAKDNALWCNSPYNEGFYVGTMLAEDYYSAKLPADAVKLGDVEAARRELAAKQYVERARANQAERERDALRADIRAVLATKQPYIGWHREQVLARLDREPGREEPNSQRTPSSPQAGSSARTLHGIVFPDHIEVDQLNNPETTIIRLQCLPHTFGRVTSGWINRGDTHLIREFVEAHAAHGHVVEHQPEGDR